MFDGLFLENIKQLKSVRDGFSLIIHSLSQFSKVLLKIIRNYQIDKLSEPLNGRTFFIFILWCWWFLSERFWCKVSSSLWKKDNFSLFSKKVLSGSVFFQFCILFLKVSFIHFLFGPFHATDLYLYPLKTSKNFWCKKSSLSWNGSM